MFTCGKTIANICKIVVIVKHEVRSILIQIENLQEAKLMLYELQNMLCNSNKEDDNFYNILKYTGK